VFDGPAASGKSSAAKMLANKLGFVYLNTGLMYRSLTAFIINNNLLQSIPESIISIIESLNIDISGNNLDIIKIDDMNYSKYYNSKEVINNVSIVSSIPIVREKLVELQRSLKDMNLVCEGRDIGTVVFPEANRKFFLSATIDCRVSRRYEEFNKDNNSISKNEIKSFLTNRDNIDKSRKISPLKIADDAILIDTTNINIVQVVDIMYEEIKGDSNTKFRQLCV
jgi:cytidylate kinase